MDRKTPDFFLDSISLPFYDCNPHSSGPMYDGFSAYPGAAQGLHLNALGLGRNTGIPGPTPIFQLPHTYPGASPTSCSFSSTSTSGSRSFSPHDPSMSGSEVEETINRAHDKTSSISALSNASTIESQRHGSAHSARYNPLAGTRPQRYTRTARRSASRSLEDISDDGSDPMDKPMDSSFGVTQRRRYEIRRQRIESDQRRRDELRDSYIKLKSALPISSQKSSKVSLLDRAAIYIRQLETSQTTLQGRLDKIENESARLRNINEELMRNLAEQHRTVIAAAAAANPPLPPSP